VVDGGCPFYDADFDWAKNVATPYIIDGMRAVAAEGRPVPRRAVL
jgi:hypothetical protein